MINNNNATIPSPVQSSPERHMGAPHRPTIYCLGHLLERELVLCSWVRCGVKDIAALPVSRPSDVEGQDVSERRCTTRHSKL
jgi:hypothetical protein